MFTRVSSASVVAAITTSALLFLMTSLIAGRPDLTPGIDKRDFTLGVAEYTPPTPKSPEAPPEPPPTPIDTPTTYRTSTETPIERVSLPTSGPGIGFEFATPPVVIEADESGEGPLVNIMSVTPLYPQRMLARGVEGYVDLQFDIDGNGTPVNIAVSNSSHTGFERAAIAALQRFRYRGGASAGAQLSAQGLEKRFTFEIDQPK